MKKSNKLGGKSSVRRCLVSGDEFNIDVLVRFVVDPEGIVVPDIYERLPGRGYWIRANYNLISEGVEKGVFQKRSKKNIQVPFGLVNQTERALRRRCCEILGLARRAGEAHTGYDAVLALLTTGKASVLITALDASINGRKKLLNKKYNALSHVDWLSINDLSLALGRENVVHAALIFGGFRSSFLREANRLLGLLDTQEYLSNRC